MLLTFSKVCAIMQLVKTTGDRAGTANNKIITKCIVSDYYMAMKFYGLVFGDT
jgi:hypothetical protein